MKDTGQKKQIAGYDTHEAIATVTVREKGKTLEDGGGMVMTNDMWLGPKIPALKELVDFDVKYCEAAAGTGGVRACRPSRWRRCWRCSRSSARPSERMQKEGGKLPGTPLETTTTFESVKSKEQLDAGAEAAAAAAAAAASAACSRRR